MNRVALNVDKSGSSGSSHRVEGLHTHTHKFQYLIQKRPCRVRPPCPSWRAACEGCTVVLPQMC